VARRQLLAVAVGSALILGTGSALAAPTASAAPESADQQLHAAQQQVRSAGRQLDAVQVRAEQAAEAYNGARLQAGQAAAASASAAAAAGAASVRAAQAVAASGTATDEVRRAVGARISTRAEQGRAEQAVATAQGRLGALAAGAYKSGGHLGFYSLLLGTDPATFADGQELISRVDRHHKDALGELVRAKAVAADAGTRAARAEQTATDRARQATSSAQQVTQSAAAARGAAAIAAGALQTSRRAAASAAAARWQAQRIVDAAQQTLGRASVTAAELAAKAEQARRDAAAARTATNLALAAAAARAAHLAQTAAAAAPAAAPQATERPSPSVPSPARVAAPLPSSQGTGPAQASAPPPIPPGTSLPGGGAAAVAVGWAFREIGVPYSWGGGDATGPTTGFAQGADTVGFDCSGLTLFAWAHAGVALGHYTGSQWTAGRHVAQSDLQPGDLVFFATDTADPATIHHVGLYIGAGDMINVAAHRRRGADSVLRRLRRLHRRGPAHRLTGSPTVLGHLPLAQSLSGSAQRRRRRLTQGGVRVRTPTRAGGRTGHPPAGVTRVKLRPARRRAYGECCAGRCRVAPCPAPRLSPAPRESAPGPIGRCHRRRC